ncbi:uncharacterized protein LOC122809518 [Protopterus annectens]|uniref:uncharacterized protein LOC122809518 n=1 Tax=Protopterus annectens TaxID=7888 RepID=UPI001CFB23FF|nr:uncharacterized protein LOC122809518 [Protopterus annectens]
MNLEMPDTFDDVAITFSEDEWKTLDQQEKELHREVMVENYETMVSVGYSIPLGHLLSLIEKDEELPMCDMKEDTEQYKSNYDEHSRKTFCIVSFLKDKVEAVRSLAELLKIDGSTFEESEELAIGQVVLASYGNKTYTAEVVKCSDSAAALQTELICREKTKILETRKATEARTMTERAFPKHSADQAIADAKKKWMQKIGLLEIQVMKITEDQQLEPVENDFQFVDQSDNGIQYGYQDLSHLQCYSKSEISLASQTLNNAYYCMNNGLPLTSRIFQRRRNFIDLPGSLCRNCILLENKIRRLEDELSTLGKHNEDLARHLFMVSSRENIDQLPASVSYSRPRSGKVSEEDAQKFNMIPIAPNIYIHTDHAIEALQKRANGDSMVRVMLRCLFSKDQLQNATLVPDGKGQTLDPDIIQAIIGWVMEKKTDDTTSRSKLRQTINRTLTNYRNKAKRRLAQSVLGTLRGRTKSKFTHCS